MSDSCSPANRLVAIALAALPLFAAKRTEKPSSDSGAAPATQETRHQPVGIDHLVTLLDQTLEVARGAPAIGVLEPVDVRALLATLISDCPVHRVKLVAPEMPVHALADPAALTTLLRFLIDAALLQDGLTGPAQVTLRLDHGASALALHVDDNGPGIPRAMRAKVLDPAPVLDVSDDTEDPPSPSLVFAQKIVRGLDGGISISSSPEGGARLTITLALLHAHEMELAAAS